MDRVDKYKRIEDDQQQGKGKVKVIPHEGFQIRPIQQQPAEKGLRRAIRVEQHPDHRCSLPRAGASSIKKNQEGTLLQMAQQDGGKSRKVKP